MGSIRKPPDLAGLGPSSSPGLPTTSRTSRTRRRCRVRAHPALDGLCRLGMGHRRRPAGARQLKRFGSVTVLNGHIHQIVQKVEGNMTFHTARSTAFPQPAPGTAASPGPITVPAEQLRSMLGVTSVDVSFGNKTLAVTYSPLAG